jgi:hypothetical protein
MKKSHFQTSVYIIFSFFLFSQCTEKKTDVNEDKELEFLFEADGVHLEEPFLNLSPDGKLFFSWIEKSDTTNKLKYAAWQDSTWSEPILIAKGQDWFVNWADYPQLASFDNGSMMAVFLQKSGPGTFAYDVMMTFSENGTEWTKPTVLHDDGSKTEHGFVSMSPFGQEMLITWLDGRNTGGNGHHENHQHSHQGQMSIRAALVDNNGNKLNEWELDNRVCDCCQTGSAITEEGPIVVFRDRSESEIRDIGLVRWVDSLWTETEPLFMDLWEIAACPVNGPRIAAFENQVAVAWYTAAKGNPEVKLVFSQDNGVSFSSPVRIDLGNTIGRIALCYLEKDKVMVTWMEEGKIFGRTVSIDGSLGKARELAFTSEKRSSGFPQSVFDGTNLWLAWTDDQSETKKIRIKRINFSEENIK